LQSSLVYTILVLADIPDLKFISRR